MPYARAALRRVLIGVFHQLYDSIVKNTGYEASDPIPVPVVNKRLNALKQGNTNRMCIEKENQFNSSSSVDDNKMGREQQRAVTSLPSNSILDKSNFRNSIDDMNRQNSITGGGTNNIIDKNAILSSRQLETLRAVQEHSREEELLEQKKRKAESDKFEKFKEHVKRKQMMHKQAAAAAARVR